MLEYLVDRDNDDPVLFGLKAQARALFKKLSRQGATPEWISKITSDRGEACYPKPSPGVNRLDVVEFAHCRFMIEHYDGQGFANDPDLRSTFDSIMARSTTARDAKVCAMNREREKVRKEATDATRKCTPEECQKAMDDAHAEILRKYPNAVPRLKTVRHSAAERLEVSVKTVRNNAPYWTGYEPKRKK